MNNIEKDNSQFGKEMKTTAAQHQHGWMLIKKK